LNTANDNDKEAKRIKKLIDKKNSIQIEIKAIHDRKYEINKLLDDIWVYDINHPDESPLKLVNEMYSLNIKLNNLRDKIDEINKKLVIRKDTFHPVWIKDYQ